MNKRERVEFIDLKLNELYPEPPIPLDHYDEYTLLIAVLLSAQCTDARVNLVNSSSPDTVIVGAGAAVCVVRSIASD